MFPCEMARCIAGFQPEARKYEPVLGALAANIRCPVRPGLGSDRAALSIPEHLADISWLPPVAAVVRPVAAEVAEVAPDGRSGAPAAGVAAGQRPEVAVAVGQQPEVAAVAGGRQSEAAMALIPAEPGVAAAVARRAVSAAA